ncbi:hypothetical protein F5Y19DRAFT_477240 [Xylariaceae sp. FL1651]|nr:hypothetical protein F5Y19DRAFT_477240 [Xylariaceae sp. FL1651]
MQTKSSSATGAMSEPSSLVHRETYIPNVYASRARGQAYTTSTRYPTHNAGYMPAREKGIIAGVFVGVLVIAIVAFLIWRWKKKQRSRA